MFITLGLKKLPFKQDKSQIIYVESKYDEEINRYIQENYDKIRSHFELRGYEFVYFPKLIDEILREDVLKYNRPYAEDVEKGFCMKSDYLLQFMLHPENKKDFPPSLLFYDPEYTDDEYPKSACLYRGWDLTTPEPDYHISDNFSLILDQIDLRDLISGKKEGFWENFIRKAKCFGEDIVSEEDDYSESIRVPKTQKPKNIQDDDLDEFDEETLKMLDEMKAMAEKLRLRGIDAYILEKLIREEVKLSRLVVTKDYRILLPDYHNTEIKLTPLPKALYLLYLNHPEGIDYHDLVDYREELHLFYKDIKGGYYNRMAAMERIDSMTNHNNNSIHEKVSRIKETFTSHFDDHVAKNYYIDGKKYQRKKISLPRELVIWEVRPKGLEEN